VGGELDESGRTIAGGNLPRSVSASFMRLYMSRKGGAEKAWASG
jgi:hypothetical protein